MFILIQLTKVLDMILVILILKLNKIDNEKYRLGKRLK